MLKSILIIIKYILFIIFQLFVFSFIIPTLIALIPGTQGVLNTVSVLATVLPLFIMFKSLWLNLFTLTNLARDGYKHIRDTIK